MSKDREEKGEERRRGRKEIRTMIHVQEKNIEGGPITEQTLLKRAVVLSLQLLTFLS